MICTLDTAAVSYEQIIHGLTKLMAPLAAQVRFFFLILLKLLDLRSAIARESKTAI